MAEQGLVRRFMRRYREARDAYLLVFVLIVLTVFLAAVAPPGSWGTVAVTALQALTLMLAARTSGVTGRLLWVVRLLALAPVAGVFAALMLGRHVAEVPYFLSLIVLIAGTQAAIIVHATEETKVTAQTVMAALSVYLMLGLLFAAVDMLVGTARGPFFAQSGTHTASDFVYYSYITLTTVGYGDLTPATGLGRACAISEALFGQLYLVTVISVVVGNLSSQRQQKEPNGS